MKEMKEQEEIEGRNKQQVLYQLAGLAARISAEIQKSPQMTDLNKSLFVTSQEKQSIAQITSTISNSDNKWNKFADEHQNF